MVKPISIKTLSTLQTLLDMYQYSKEEILLLEAIANGMDAKATKIYIDLVKDNSGYYITFLNNGPHMNNTEFENYHIISSSTKTKGDGIGFAGVGAKIFLAAWDKSQIVTITGKDDKILASKMFRKDDDVLYDSTLNGASLKDITGKSVIKHKEGTSYKVKISSDGYTWFKNNISKKLQFWFNDALVGKKLELFVDGKTISPWIPAGEKYTKKINYQNHIITCNIYICDIDIDEEQTHIIYSVFGKRIKNEPVKWLYQIKKDYSSKVICMADVSILAQNLMPNKEEFRKSNITSKIKSLVNTTFYNELKQHGLIFEYKEITQKTEVVYNELTKKLDKMLQTPDLKFLNPFSNPRTHYVTVKDDDGNITVREDSGKQQKDTASGDDLLEGLTTSRDDTPQQQTTSGDQKGTSHYEDKSGDKPGKNKNKKTRGIYIIPEDYPNDEREGWIDMNNRAVVYNTGHKFAKTFETNPSLRDFNLTRVVISSLIKAKNDQTDMDAVTTLQYFEKILHGIYI